jgi:uncharacterized membrane protein HdeD (DUF308 family)
MDTVIVVGTREHRGPRWPQLLAGVVAILVGVFLFVEPARATVAVLQAFAVLWLVLGTLAVLESIVVRPRKWGWHLLAGVLGIGAGGLVLAQPLLAAMFTTVTLLFFVVLLVLLLGVIEIASGLFGGRSWSRVLIGVLQVLLALLLLVYPQTGAALLAQVLAVVPVFFGILLVVTSWLTPDLELRHV